MRKFKIQQTQTKYLHFEPFALISKADAKEPHVYTGWPKKVSHYQIIKKCVKSHWSLQMRLHFFVKLMKWSSTIILSVSI